MKPTLSPAPPPESERLAPPRPEATGGGGLAPSGGPAGQGDRIHAGENFEQRAFHEDALVKFTGLKLSAIRRAGYPIAPDRITDQPYTHPQFVRLLSALGLVVLDGHGLVCAIQTGLDLPELLKFCSEKNAAPALPHDAQKNPRDLPPMVGTVHRFPLNPQLLNVRLATGAIVKVRIANRANFRLNMTVPVRPTRDPQIWELARKLPRFPGRF